MKTMWSMLRETFLLWRFVDVWIPFLKNCVLLHHLNLNTLTGVALLANNLCLSVSLDQRLILWKREDTRLRWLSPVCCDISDIQGLDVSVGASKTSLPKILVYGQGIQIFEVDNLFNITEHHSQNRLFICRPVIRLR